MLLGPDEEALTFGNIEPTSYEILHSALKLACSCEQGNDIGVLQDGVYS
jgi:hypothetical protein